MTDEEIKADLVEYIKFRGWNEIEEKMLNWNELLNKNLKNIFTMQKKTQE